MSAADTTDVEGTGDEDFEVGMRQNAAERSAADADNDGKLDFTEFMEFVRNREEGEFTDEELKARFDALDEDGSGKVDMSEYLMWSLKDALARSSQRVVDLFRAWDEDNSGTIDNKEFHKAVRALGFDVTEADTDAVFNTLDFDNSGMLEYKELNEMLRQGVGSEKAKANLKRARDKAPDHSRGAKLTAKNLNTNYVGSRTAALPDTVKLEKSDEMSVQEQLHVILSKNSVKLIDLFREWDDDGNGALDKKEFRKAVAALGYDAPRKEVDGIFDSMDGDKSGFIEFDEFKKQLSEKGAKAASKQVQAAAKANTPAAAGDVAGTGEETFEAGMRQNAMERDAADADQDGKLDFTEFCAFVRDREEGEFTDEELKARFDALDEDGSGKVDMAEYLHWSLKDALARSSQRVVDLFRAWDEDKSGTVDKEEFHKAVRALGFDVTKADTDLVFETLDDDNSGMLEYKELSEMLRKGVGSEKAKANLKRAQAKAPDRGRGAKLTAKNINVNYVGSRTAALPDTVKLEKSDEMSVQEQLHQILSQNSVKLIDLFREWDDDGNGALDKKEFRRAIAALGYDAPRKAVDAMYDSMDEDSSGWIEFEEFKRSLSEKGAKAATKQLKAAQAKEAAKGGKADATDVAGDGEEDFETGMRQNAMERDAADADNDGKLDFTEFCAFVRDREEGEFTDEELKARFDKLDEDGSGKVDMHEYLQWSLKDALMRSSQRVVDLFRAWDEDRSGTVDKKEFNKAIRALGFEVEQADTDAVFESLDDDKSGSLEYKELNEMLRKGSGSEKAKANLKRVQGKAPDRGRGAKLTAKNINVNYVGVRTAALPPTVKLEKSNEMSVQEQLHQILSQNSVKLIDLFREWDDDGNGALDKKEMRQAIAALGYDASRKDMDAVFDSIDVDGSGFIEYEEFKKALSEKGAKAATKEVKKKAASKNAADDDVAGTGEEDFEAGMKQNAADRDAADADNDGKLDFTEFCAFVRDREEGEFTEAELKARFDKLDEDGSGKVDMHEYLQWSLKDALFRSAQRVVDLFRAWECAHPECPSNPERALRHSALSQSSSFELLCVHSEDKSGTVDKKEFNKAIRALGFDVEQADTDAVFESLDDDKSGSLEYKELNEMLRKGVGAEKAKANLKRAQSKAPDRGRGAKITNKNINVNYVGTRTAALPDTVKLEKSAEMSVQEQLYNILQTNSVKLIDLFREWDDDGNGGLDKKEFRAAIAALGYEASRKDMDAVYDSIDVDGSGFIEFEEFKKSLSAKGAKEASKQVKKAAKGSAPAAAGDVAGTGEEDFATGMRQNAMERDAADADQDGKLDFTEFCAFVRDREEGEFTEAELRTRFDKLDEDGSGKVDMAEYLHWSLKDALARSSNRVVDLFRAWDDDNSGTVDKAEFHKAVRALGFDVERADTDLVFETLDDDNSGSLEYGELNEMLRKNVGSEKARAKLKRAQAMAPDRGRGAKLTAKNINVNYVSSRTAALPDFVTLELSEDYSVEEQLRNILQANSVKLIDLFREWDDDGNGALNKKEFRQAIAALGYDAPRKDIDAVFDAMDADASGWIEYEEFKKALSDKGVKAAQDRMDAAAKAAGRELPSLKPRPPPPHVKPLSLGHNQLQLAMFLTKHNVKVLEMFREWDDDKNGTLDKKELRKCVATLGYYAKDEDVDGLFDIIDETGDGNIDFTELKRALNSFSKGRQPSPRRGSSENNNPYGLVASRAPSMPDPSIAKLASMPPIENPGELVLPAGGTHSHTLVFLHAEGSTADAYSRLYRRFGHLAVNCRFVFLRAPSRVERAHWSAAAKSAEGLRCWFLPPEPQRQRSDFLRGDSSAPPEAPEVAAAVPQQLATQTSRIHTVLDREASLLGGATDRIILGGHSQGGAIAIHAAMSYGANLGALICLRTSPLASTEATPARNGGTPVFVFAGGNDATHPLPSAKEAYSRLSSVGHTLEWHVEPSLNHTAESLNEQRYVAYWAARASLGKSDPAAVDSLRRLLVVKKEKQPRPPLTARPQTSYGTRVTAGGRGAAKRAQSARPTTVDSKENARAGSAIPGERPTGGERMVERIHPLLKEPSWRWGPGSARPKPSGKPDWDLTPMRGLPPPTRLAPISWELAEAAPATMARPETSPSRSRGSPQRGATRGRGGNDSGGGLTGTSPRPNTAPADYSPTFENAAAAGGYNVALL